MIFCYHRGNGGYAMKYFKIAVGYLIMGLFIAILFCLGGKEGVNLLFSDDQL